MIATLLSPRLNSPRLRLLPLFLLALCLALPAPVPTAAETPLRFGQGLLWRIETPDRADSFIFGTMHATDPKILELPVPVQAALKGARTLVLEMVMTDAVQRELGTAMVMSDGRRLDRIIGVQRFAALAQIGEMYGLRPEALRLLAPWAAMTVISMAPSEYERISQGVLPLDESLQQRVRQRGLPVQGLETVEEQISVFRDIPEREQIALLDLAVRAHVGIEGWYVRMKDAYLTRDLARLARIMREQSMAGDQKVMEDFETRLIKLRNVRMAVRMIPHLDAGGAFIAVGALHLPGENGVLQLVERQGRTVTRLY